MIAKLKGELFKGLAHPTRIQILELLKVGELCVCTIYEELEQSQSNISQHLSKLKKSNLVKSKKDGLKVFYSLKNDKIIDILKLSKEILLEELDQTKKSLTEEE